VPRLAPLITTSLHRRRLTVAGVASRRIRVPVKCSTRRILSRRLRSLERRATGRRFLYDLRNESTVSMVHRSLGGIAQAGVCLVAAAALLGLTARRAAAQPAPLPTSSNAPGAG